MNASKTRRKINNVARDLAECKPAADDLAVTSAAKAVLDDLRPNDDWNDNEEWLETISSPRYGGRDFLKCLFCKDSSRHFPELVEAVAVARVAGASLVGEGSIVRIRRKLQEIAEVYCGR
jgi:hypothetical protein